MLFTPRIKTSSSVPQLEAGKWLVPSSLYYSSGANGNSHRWCALSLIRKWLTRGWRNGGQSLWYCREERRSSVWQLKQVWAFVFSKRETLLCACPCRSDQLTIIVYVTDHHHSAIKFSPRYVQLLLEHRAQGPSTPQDKRIKYACRKQWTQVVQNCGDGDSKIIASATTRTPFSAYFSYHS